MHPTAPDGNGLPADNGTSAALDDLFAELSGTAPVESPEEIGRRIEALRLAIDADARTDRGSAPQGDAPPPIVEHAVDDSLFDRFGPDHVRAVIEDSLDGAIVQHIVRRGGLGLDATGLAGPVRTIRNHYLDAVADGHVTRVGEPVDSIVRDLLADRPRLTRLREMVAQPDLDLPLPQAGAVVRFFDAYPGFWAALVPRTTAIRFDSRTADSRGGGLFHDDGVIYLSKLHATPPSAFVRLLVHETGHATFERILLAGGSMPHALGVAKALPEHNTAETGREVKVLQTYWDGMSDPAKTFYHAWLTLRADNGRHLLGLDLWQDPRGHRLSPAQRRAYQAQTFGEFCAEMFMLYAMGDLRPHVEAALADHTVPAEVRTAWRNAWHVLVTVAATILGDRV